MTADTYFIIMTMLMIYSDWSNKNFPGWMGVLWGIGGVASLMGV